MTERLRRWRLVLGADAEEIGHEPGGGDADRDRILTELYGSERRGGLGASAPRVARWLGDIRANFPSGVVQVMQRDAIDRLGLHQLLLEPELLGSVTPDVHLVSTLLALRGAIPEHSRQTVRAIVRTVAEDLERRLAAPMVQALRGALHRAARTNRPRPGDVDWHRTVLANLKHYQPELGTIIPERLIGYGRRDPRVQREIVLALDTSGSMADSVVHAGVLASILASVRAVRTRVVAFDTSVVDLTEFIDDPVDMLFGVQLGGGTDIAQALTYCAQRITRPRDTVLVLLSDLFEGAPLDELIARVRGLVGAGVTVVVLLALSDAGAPAHDAKVAEALADLGVPAFACTPDRFGELMAAAIERRDLGAWASAEGLVLAAPA